MDNIVGSTFCESEKAVTGFMAIVCTTAGSERFPSLGKSSEPYNYGKPYTTAKGVRSFPRKTLG